MRLWDSFSPSEGEFASGVRSSDDARRQADVPVRERRAERMDGRVEPPRTVVEPNRREHPLGKRALEVGCVWLVEERRVDARSLAYELGQNRADGGEDLRHLARLHERLEVVEERRVRGVVPLEALDVAPLELEIPPERREEAREVVLRPCLDPDLVAERRGADHLGAEIGRHTPLLLPVAAGNAHEARVVRVVLERLLEWTQALEHGADLGIHELLVGDATERRE
ncbi:MAG: hypothetical protein HW413_840 [Thermoleophilia bacterium]|nr:hypothetical protein [Thermoleophilia bacterium]